MDSHLIVVNNRKIYIYLLLIVVSMRSRIECINRLPVDVDEDKANLTLVYAGVKPATILKRAGGRYDAAANIDRLELWRPYRLAVGLAQIGLPFHIAEPQLKRYGRDMTQPLAETLTIYVAKDREWLDRLMMASTNEEYGICYGYPQTAIDAYNGELEKLPRDYPIPDEYLEAFTFSQFEKSMANWQSEIEIGRQYAEVLKELNRPMYRRLMNPEEDILITCPL
jgi:hypothetical protein